MPETRADSHGISYSFLAIGTYGAIGTAPFGADSLTDEDTAELRRTYAQLGALDKDILLAQTQDRLRGFRVAGTEEETLTLGSHRFLVKRHTERGHGKDHGYGLLLQSDEHTYIAVGHNYTLTLLPRDGRPGAVLQADELAITNGGLVPRRRRLNGDETGVGTHIRIAADPARIHGFMPASGNPSGVVRFSVHSLMGQ
ncbi:DUF5597 domain-containing protein [Streptomyces sp. CA-179760]|uniref:DUF5597 domain-containing protein n=1 Tax=Streptomyces sp. CA-179760 TaxID=3240054 RepID=UPI003D949C8E